MRSWKPSFGRPRALPLTSTVGFFTSTGSAQVWVSGTAGAACGNAAGGGSEGGAAGATATVGGATCALAAAAGAGGATEGAFGVQVSMPGKAPGTMSHASEVGWPAF